MTPRIDSLHAGGWMVEKTGIRNEVAIMDSRGWSGPRLRVDKAREGRGSGRG